MRGLAGFKMFLLDSCSLLLEKKYVLESSLLTAVGLNTLQSKHPVQGQRQSLNHRRLFHCYSKPDLAISEIAFSDYWLYTEEVSQQKISPG